MQAKKSLLAAGVGTAVGLATFAGVAVAQTPATGQQTLVDKIATRFNLNKDDVQKVFDEDRAAHHVVMEQRSEDRLTQAVKDGKITEAQKTAILDKHKELMTYMESIKDKPDSEEHTLMKAKFDELKQWAADNNLSDYFHIAGGPGHNMHGPGMGMMRIHEGGDGPESDQ